MITFSEQSSASLDVFTNSTNVLSDDAWCEDLDVARPAIGVLVRDDGVGTEWNRCPRHDLHRGSRREPVECRLARCNLTDDRQAERRILGGLTHILSAYGVAIHSRIVESREVDGGH